MRWTNNPPAPLVGRRIGPIPHALYWDRALVDRIGRDAPLDAYPWVAWLEEFTYAGADLVCLRPKEPKFQYGM